MLYGICRSSRRRSRPEVFCRPNVFHRTPLMVASEHEIQAPTLTAGREQEDEFSNSPDNESTNEEEKNSTEETNNKSLEDELDIELFVNLVRRFLVIWNTRLNGFKDYKYKKVTLDNKYARESMFFHCRSIAA